MLTIEETILPDVLILTPKRFGDERGWFSETWNEARLADAGLDLNFVQGIHRLPAVHSNTGGGVKPVLQKVLYGNNPCRLTAESRNHLSASVEPG